MAIVHIEFRLSRGFQTLSFPLLVSRKYKNGSACLVCFFSDDCFVRLHSDPSLLDNQSIFSFVAGREGGKAKPLKVRFAVIAPHHKGR